MKKIFIKLSVAALIFTAISSFNPVLAQRPSAVLNRIDRAVEVKRAGSEEWNRARAGDFLNEGDTVRTGSRAEAEIVFLAGVEVLVSADTEFEVKPAEIERPVATDLELLRGGVFTRTRGSADMEVRTPQAVVAVRGTEFGVEVSHLTQVYVLSGSVDVFNDLGEVNLGAGEETRVEGGRPPDPPSKSLEDDKSRRTRDDTRELLMISMRSEAPAGAGTEYEIMAVDSDGDILTDTRGRVEVSVSGAAEFSEDGLSWRGFPGRINLRDGRATFYVKPAAPGRILLTGRSENFSPGMHENIFRVAEKRELYLEIRDGSDDYRIKIEFERDE